MSYLDWHNMVIDSIGTTSFTMGCKRFVLWEDPRPVDEVAIKFRKEREQLICIPENYDTNLVNLLKEDNV